MPLISNTATYMVKEVVKIKCELRNSFFHVQFLTHLMHNCAMNYKKANYENAEFLISSVKAVTIKNNRISNESRNIGKSPNGKFPHTNFFKTLILDPIL